MATVAGETASARTSERDAAEARADGLVPEAGADAQGQGTKSKPHSKDASEDEDVEFSEVLQAWTEDIKEEARQHDQEILKLIKALGGNSGKYRRERSKKLRAIRMEFYTP